MTNIKKILLYGYGNPGRQDDGLGNEFVDEMEKWVADNKIEYVEFDSNYQLNIEDADTISDKDIVVFIDASIEENVEDFLIDKIEPSKAKVEFSMHAVSAAFVVNLCNDIYSKFPKCYLVHIKGYEWDFGEGLTDQARKNLDKAIAYIKDRILEEKDFVN